MNKTVKTISELKDILLEEKELEESVLVFCNLDILIIYISSMYYEENVIVSARIIKRDSKKLVSIKTKDNQARTFYIDGNVLVSSDNRLCIYQKEYSKEILHMLDTSRQNSIKNCINQLKQINEDYISTIKVINSYDSKNK
jgi:hypothetical protein